jgi:hypothetical protein
VIKKAAAALDFAGKTLAEARLQNQAGHNGTTVPFLEIC